MDHTGYGTALPRIIQGGMGVGVSNWVLARAVASRGELGVVSGTALDSVLVRRLQDGDPGGHVRRAIENFPIPEAGAEVLKRFFRPEGRRPDQPYKMLPMYRQVVSKAREQITILANFVEVFLAKEGHEGRVGINLLTKIQMPTIASLYGAMLAGVDYVLMGAGIPREIPGVLDRLAGHQPASIRFDVEELPRNESRELTFDPMVHHDERPPALNRPRFLPIISSDALAAMLARKATGRIDGFVIEGPTAGGHNAPPRGRLQVNERNEPVYGERDAVNLEKIREIGLPFWLAGGVGSPDGLQRALDEGAAGIQVGTLFAYCDESGISEEFRLKILEDVRRRRAEILTDISASPTGFPFKVVKLEDSLSEAPHYASRERICDLGYLRVPYQREDGRIGYRCASEPVDAFVEKGGSADEAAGRKCLCNALMADIGHAQVRKGVTEKPLITSGDDLKTMASFLGDRTRYSAADVLDFLLGA